MRAPEFTESLMLNEWRTAMSQIENATRTVSIRFRSRCGRRQNLGCSHQASSPPSEPLSARPQRQNACGTKNGTDGRREMKERAAR